VIRGVKPKTHLMIDLVQFFLLIALVLTALMALSTPGGREHIRFMFHAVHAIAGIALCLTVGLHLYLHLPWIAAQLKRLLQS
jgi:hypothetical protein